MPKSRIIIALGVLIALLPLLGFPHSWEAFFQVLAGLSIVLFSIWASIDKRLSLKAKAQRRQAHKLREAELASPTEQSFGRGTQAETNKQTFQEEHL